MRYGVRSVAGGRDATIATREAVVGDDLATLDETVLAGLRAERRRFSRRREMTAIRAQSLCDEALATIYFPCCDNLKLAKAAALPIPHLFFLSEM